MKKLFIFLAAIVAATTMQAAIETLNVDWTLEIKVDEEVIANNTFTVGGWGSASKWSWLNGAGEYEQLVIEVADHTADILVTGYFTTDGNSQDKSSGIMRAGTNIVAVDVENTVLQAIEVKNWSGAEATISVTKMYLRRATGTKKTETLWEGPLHFDDYKDWGDEIILSDDAFADAHIGDILVFDYTLDEDGYYQMSVQTSYNHYRPTFLGTLDAYDNYIFEKQANPNKLSWAIMDETDLNKLKTDGGLRINGALFTANDVKLIKHNNGTVAIDNVNANAKGVKVLRDGIMYIQRGENLYNMQGQIVK